MGLRLLKPAGDDLNLGYRFFRFQDLHSAGVIASERRARASRRPYRARRLGIFPQKLGMSVIQITASQQFDAHLRSGLRPAAMATRTSRLTAPAADVGLTGPCAHAQIYAKAGA